MSNVKRNGIPLFLLHAFQFKLIGGNLINNPYTTTYLKALVL